MLLGRERGLQMEDTGVGGRRGERKREGVAFSRGDADADTRDRDGDVAVNSNSILVSRRLPTAWISQYSNHPKTTGSRPI